MLNVSNQEIEAADTQQRGRDAFDQKQELPTVHAPVTFQKRRCIANRPRYHASNAVETQKDGNSRCQLFTLVKCGKIVHNTWNIACLEQTVCDKNEQKGTLLGMILQQCFQYTLPKEETSYSKCVKGCHEGSDNSDASP